MNPVYMTETLIDANGKEMRIEAQPKNIYPEGWLSAKSARYSNPYATYGHLELDSGIHYLDGTITIVRFHDGAYQGVELFVPSIKSDRWTEITYVTGFKTRDEAIMCGKSQIRFDFMVSIKDMVREIL